jgi:hypothetical protein
VLLELAAQQMRVGRLSREPIAVLCQHHANAPGGHEVLYTVHTGPLKAGLKAGIALSGVYYLL